MGTPFNEPATALTGHTSRRVSRLPSVPQQQRQSRFERSVAKSNLPQLPGTSSGFRVPGSAMVDASRSKKRKTKKSAKCVAPTTMRERIPESCRRQRRGSDYITPDGPILSRLNVRSDMTGYHEESEAACGYHARMKAAFFEGVLSGSAAVAEEEGHQSSERKIRPAYTYSFGAF